MVLIDKRKPRNAQAGLTLLEVMVVLAIIALVVGLSAPRLMSSFGRAKAQAASVQMANLKGALQLYYIDLGRYPTETEGLKALISPPVGAANWLGPYVDSEEALTDPWGRTFLYQYPSAEGDFALITLGRDGQPGGSREDSDITS